MQCENDSLRLEKWIRLVVDSSLDVLVVWFFFYIF